MSPCPAIERCFAESPFVQKKKVCPFFRHLSSVISCVACVGESMPVCDVFEAYYMYIYLW